MAENISDINTEDEESIKHTRHDRAAAKNVTSDESSDSEMDSSQLLSPLPDPKEFSGFQSRKPRILATYEQPFILPETNKIVGTEQKTSKIVQQEALKITKHKKKDLEDNQQSFINEDNAIDEYKDLILLNNNENQSEKGKIH